MKRGIVFIGAALSLLIMASQSTGEMKITPRGVSFPDGTTQTTSATGESGMWSASGFNIYYSSGNVGINIADPGERLEVVGNIEVSGNGNGIKFPDGTIQTTASAPTWHQILPAADRFQLVMSDQAVLDKETGLVWQRGTDDTTRAWGIACNYCYQLNLGGRKGWRPPTIEELSSLVDPSQSNPALPEGHPFTNAKSSNYWSSSTGANDPDYAWPVYFTLATWTTAIRRSAIPSGVCAADMGIMHGDWMI